MSCSPVLFATISHLHACLHVCNPENLSHDSAATLRLKGGARKYFIAGNWKLNPTTLEEAKSLATAVSCFSISSSLSLSSYTPSQNLHVYDPRMA